MASQSAPPAAPPLPAREKHAGEAIGLINVPKSCDVLAERLQQQILKGVYPPGSTLPTEYELVAASGLRE